MPCRTRSGKAATQDNDAGSGSGDDTDDYRHVAPWSERELLRYAGIVGVDPLNYSLAQLYDMVEAKREFNWQIVHKQTLDIINSFRSSERRLKSLGYPYCNITQKPLRDATEAENEEWLIGLASAYNMTITKGDNNG